MTSPINMYLSQHDMTQPPQDVRVAFVGAVGLPNRYGGFEAFLEHCAPVMADEVEQVIVTCDRHAYLGEKGPYRGVERRFLGIRANGAMSVLHDLVAFLAVYRESTHIVVLGVSGGLWFPLFKAMTWCGRKTLAVNIDGIEWQRGKFSRFRKAVLYAFDHIAQRFADVVVYDNVALAEYVSSASRARATMIPYSGDHVLRLEPAAPREGGLTICRIEPENNIEMLIVGALASSLAHYTIVGNWTNSAYGQALRAKYGTEPRLRMVDPIYDQTVLARYREDCAVYLHGHSVGGTNPSLVEMLFYDCRILCLDVSYHRETAKDCAAYFPDAATLTTWLDQLDELPLGDRTARRQRYTRATITHAYLDALGVARKAW